MNLREIFENNLEEQKKIELLKKKSVLVPDWSKLRRSYDPEKHKIVRDYRGRPNRTLEDGTTENATRYRFGLEKLLVSRMAGFMFTIPVKRVYPELPKEATEEQRKRRSEIIHAIEQVYKLARLDNENLNRAKQFFASCEMFTLWYTTGSPHSKYGFPSQHKFKCKTYSPMDNNTKLFPLFDDTGDMIAMSIEYRNVENSQSVTYFETYTKDKHYKWHTTQDGWVAEEPKDISSYGKIPGVYMYRTEPLFGSDLDYIRQTLEYKMSENSDTISDNAAPILATAGKITGLEKRSDSKRVVSCENGGKVEYVTWDQGVESTKFHFEQMLDMYFMLAQLPNISASKMMNLSNVSYESRQLLFADAHMKVGQESGDWLEFLDREFSLVKQFLKEAHQEWAKDIDAIDCDHVITPYIQDDKKASIETLMRANGDKPLMSQKTAIQHLGMSDDADAEIAQIQAEEAAQPAQNDDLSNMYTVK